jgi:hypothetical protein
MIDEIIAYGKLHPFWCLTNRLLTHHHPCSISILYLSWYWSETEILFVAHHRQNPDVLVLSPVIPADLGFVVQWTATPIQNLDRVVHVDFLAAVSSLSLLVVCAPLKEEVVVVLGSVMQYLSVHVC